MSNIAPTTRIQSPYVPPLPGEMVVNIFSFLDIEDFAKVPRVSQLWNQCSKQPLLWKLFLKWEFKLLEVPEEYPNPQEFYKTCYVRRKNFAVGRYSQLLLQGKADRITSPAFSIERRLIFSGSSDRKITCWNSQTGELMQELDVSHSDFDTDLHVAPNGKQLISSGNGSIKIWDIQNPRAIKPLKERHKLEDPCFIFDKSGTRFILADSQPNNAHIEVWENDVLIMNLKGHTDRIDKLLLSQDETLLFSSSFDNTVKIWDLEKKCNVATLAHARDIRSLVHSAVNNKLITIDVDCAVRIWDLAPLFTNPPDTCALSYTQIAHKGFSITLSEDETQIFLVSTLSITILRFDSTDCKNLPGLHSYVKRTFLSEDQKKLIIFDEWQTKIFNLETQKTVYTVTGTIAHAMHTEKGQLIFTSTSSTLDSKTIKVLNFDAPNNAIFKELAETFKNKRDFDETIRRFLLMPEKEKNEIYIEMDKIINNGQDLERGKKHFLGTWHMDGAWSTIEQKIEAIFNYLTRK